MLKDVLGCTLQLICSQDVCLQKSITCAALLLFRWTVSAASGSRRTCFMVVVFTLMFCHVCGFAGSYLASARTDFEHSIQTCTILGGTLLLTALPDVSYISLVSVARTG